MSLKFSRSLLALFGLLLTTLAAALPPALPAAGVAEQAVGMALGAAPTGQVPSARTAAAQTQAAQTQAAQTRAAQTQAAQTQAAQIQAAQARAAQLATLQLASNRTRELQGAGLIVKCTAYSSVPGQTDSTPFITSTGTHVRSGVVALSRDLLQRFPYGTRLKIEDLSHPGNPVLANRVFVVEDTMHVRKVGQIDIWMGNLGQARAWGYHRVRITPLN